MGFIDDQYSRKEESDGRRSANKALLENASAADNAGLEVRVTREYDGVGLSNNRGCKFCLDRCGEDMTLAEAYRKRSFEIHDGCGCIIDTSFKKDVRAIEHKNERRGQKDIDHDLEQRKKYRIDTTIDDLYNNPSGNKTIGELRSIYIRDVEEGWISPISGFDNYLRLYSRIENEIIGLKTRSGVVVKSQSEHFLARVIGTSLNPSNVKNGVYIITGINPQGHRSNARSGVTVEDIKNAIENGIISKTTIGRIGKSQKYIGEKCVVTINPDTGNLIQCNPIGGI